MHLDRNAFHHLLATVSTPRYLFAFATTGLLSLGGFMLMPFGGAFTMHNLGIDIERLPVIYLISGLASILIGPAVGRACDRFGKFPVFVFGSLFSMVMVLIYTNMSVTPLPLVILVNVFMFIDIFSRMIPSQALQSAIPAPTSRGTFMSLNASTQQMAGGMASVTAGLIVSQRADGSLEHFNVLGFILLGTALSALVMRISFAAMYRAMPDLH